MTDDADQAGSGGPPEEVGAAPSDPSSDVADTAAPEKAIFLDDNPDDPVSRAVADDSAPSRELREADTNDDADEGD